MKEHVSRKEAVTLKDEEKQEEPPPRPPLLPSCRLTLAILCFLATFNMIGTRLNLSFAIVCMVKTPGLDPTYNNDTGVNVTNKYDVEDEDCKPIYKNRNSSGEWDIEEEGEFEWSKELQGHILGAFFYGYMVTQVIGGWLSDRVGGKSILIAGTLVANILAMVTPEAARVSPTFLFAVRVLQGGAQGFTHPTIMVLFSRWTAPNERAFLFAIAYAGFNVASAVIYPLSGFLCQYGFAGGWPSVFYVIGISGVIQSGLTWFMVYDSPEQHPRISEKELKYLHYYSAIRGTDYKRKDHRVPWIAILKSVPIHAFVWTHLFLRWGFHTLQLNLPMFMKEALYLDINQNGILSGVPYMGTLVSHLAAAKLFDYMRSKNFCNLTVLRKTFNTIGLVIPGATLIIIIFLTCHQKYWAVAIIALGQIMAEFAFMGGYFFSIIDIAPRLSGLLIGIANSISVATGFLCPAAIAALTPQGTREEWAKVFYLAAASYFLAAAIYLFFGSSKLQPWAREDLQPVAQDPGTKEPESVAMLHTNGEVDKNNTNGEL